MIKLELGKRYVKRDGQVTSGLLASGNQTFPFMDALSMWTPDGCYRRDHEEDPRDILRIYDDLQSLVDKMNEGERARDELINRLGKACLEYHEPGIDWNESTNIGGVTYRLKPKKQWHVFPVMNGLDVIVDNGHLKIGCMTWPLDQAMGTLTALLGGAHKALLGGATRAGIRDDQDHTLPWDEAQKIYDAIVEYQKVK